MSCSLLPSHVRVLGPGGWKAVSLWWAGAGAHCSLWPGPGWPIHYPPDVQLLTWASCCPASVDTCRYSSQSVLFPKRRMTTSSDSASCTQNMFPQPHVSGTCCEPGPGWIWPRPPGKADPVPLPTLHTQPTFYITPTPCSSHLWCIPFHLQQTYPSSQPANMSPTLQGQPQSHLPSEAFLDCSCPGLSFPACAEQPSVRLHGLPWLIS